MRPTISQSQDLLPKHSPKTVAAISLLDDFDSLRTRTEAAYYLEDATDYPDSFLPLVWRSLCNENSSAVVTSTIRGLGNLAERAGTSIPLLAHFLNDERKGVAEAAAQSLLKLSQSIEHALIPLFANPLAVGAKREREKYVDTVAISGETFAVALVRESRWLDTNDSHSRAKWLSHLPRTGLDTLSPTDRLRFMLIFADPLCQNVWGCLKVLWYSEKSSSTQTQGILQQLAICEGSFLKQITSDGLYIKARYLAQALVDTQGFAASLATSVGTMTVGVPSQSELLRHIAAVRLAPDFPPPASLDAIISALWLENNRFERELALRGLHEVMAYLGDESAQYLIGQIFNLLQAPPKLKQGPQRLFCREVCEVVSHAKSKELPLILHHVRELCEGNAPICSKKAALQVVIHLDYDLSGDPCLRDAIELLEGYAKGADRPLANVAEYARNAIERKVANAHIRSIEGINSSD